MSVHDVCFDDEGFSTVGVVLALLISLSLIFASAQVYRINSAATIQETADAAALAAEDVVAEFYIAVRVCDALVLSMTLTGAVVMGAGIAALCIPQSAPVGGKLIAIAEKVFKARNSFAEKAVEGLNNVQKSLTFLAAADSAAVVSANAQADGDAGYFGFALLLPVKGKDIQIGGADKAQAAMADVQENRDELEEAAEKADKAAREANEAKEEGYRADCGDNPGYCLYERAKTLASLSDDKNPYYATADAWSFAVALRRAQAYYPARLAAESPEGSSISAQADSELRKRFYRYASKTVAKGFVKESDDSFSANFPLLPRNTSEMKETELYTESVYPITENGKKKTMHAFSGCPQAASAVGTSSIKDLDEGGFETCPDCEFTVSSLGKVVAASSTIDNGFEYHYRKVAEAAQRYQKAREEQKPESDKAKHIVRQAFEELSAAMTQAASQRIDAKPPGRYGSVAIVATTKSLPADSGFENSFVSTGVSLGTRAAISSAVLASDKPQETASVLSSLLDGFKGQGETLGVTGAGMVLDAWSSLLFAYTQGESAVENGLRSLLNRLPLVGPSGLGTWASGKFKETVEGLGLKPAKLDAPKPILANSYHALSRDGSEASARFLSVKKAAAQMTGQDLFSGAVSVAETYAVKKVRSINDEIVIATIQPFGDAGPSLPVTITLPPAVKNTGEGLISELAARLRSIRATMTDVVQWR